MNELNPLVLALNEIDTRYIVEHKRRKRPIALMIAAAAAAMTLLTGFTARIISVDNPGVHVGQEYKFDYNLTVKKNMNILTKDELQKMGAIIDLDSFEYGIYNICFPNVLPSEILKLYNADPITLDNDNFIEEPSDVWVHSTFNTDNFEFYVLNFDYPLTHKTTGITLDITCSYLIDYRSSVSSGHEDYDPDYEIVDLNDGSKAVVFSYKTDMSYKGVCYNIFSWGETDIDGMKQVLADLGVL